MLSIIINIPTIIFANQKISTKTINITIILLLLFLLLFLCTREMEFFFFFFNSCIYIYGWEWDGFKLSTYILSQAEPHHSNFQLVNDYQHHDIIGESKSR